MNLRCADLIVSNARLWSDGARIPGADALAIADGRVMAVGRESELEPLATPGTRRLDAAGGTVTPGLTDAHIHLEPWSRARAEVSLLGAADCAEALDRVVGFLAAHPGPGPVLGRGWAADAWSAPPERKALDAVTAGRPVLLFSKDFHALWVNSAALERAGVTRTTPAPAGGAIERDATGEPSGIVRENAVGLFATLEAEAVSGAGPEDERLCAAARALHAQGVTAVHDFERGAGALRAMRALATGEGPRLRVLQALRAADLDHLLAAGIQSGVGDDRFRLGALKLFADGTLGSRTAAMLAPYEGTTETGMDTLVPAELRAAVAAAFRGGISVAIHAIGDRACRHALDAIEAAGEWRGRVALTPRIEHAQLVDPADLPRFAALGVAASMQPAHCVADIDHALRGWGARADYSYPWRTLLASGTALAFGSDAPVESPYVGPALRAALTRQREDGSPAGGFAPLERITLDQALTAFTDAPARLAGAWPRLGTLRVGAAADVVVWDADLHALTAMDLDRVGPRWTLMDGGIVHEQTPADRPAPARAPHGARATAAAQS